MTRQLREYIEWHQRLVRRVAWSGNDVIWGGLTAVLAGILAMWQYVALILLVAVGGGIRNRMLGVLVCEGGQGLADSGRGWLILVIGTVLPLAVLTALEKVGAGGATGTLAQAGFLGMWLFNGYYFGNRLAMLWYLVSLCGYVSLSIGGPYVVAVTAIMIPVMYGVVQMSCLVWARPGRPLVQGEKSSPVEERVTGLLAIVGAADERFIAYALGEAIGAVPPVLVDLERRGLVGRPTNWGRRSTLWRLCSNKAATM